MEPKEVKYEELKLIVGQKILCTNLDDPCNDLWEQHLTIGKQYIVEDLEWRFPDRVCVKSDNGKTHMFMPCKFFVPNMKAIRKAKLEKINNIVDKS